MDVARFGSGTISVQVTAKLLDRSCLVQLVKRQEEECADWKKTKADGTSSRVGLKCVAVVGTTCTFCSISKTNTPNPLGGNLWDEVQKCKVKPLRCMGVLPEDYKRTFSGVS